MFIVQHRKIFFAITGALAVISLAAIAIFGLKPGTDFTGGTLIQATYVDGRPAPEGLSAALDEAGFCSMGFAGLLI